MLASHATRIWNIAPLVLTIDDFLDVEACAALIALGAGRVRPSQVRGHDGMPELSKTRTNSDILLPPGDFPEVLPVLMKIGALMRLPLAHAEGLNLLHYQVAQEFQPHADGLVLSVAGKDPERFRRQGGQRLFSTLVYLNDVAAGGGTAFPDLGLVIDPVPGRLLVFANTPPGGRHPDPLSRHAGLPVTSGEKWAAIAWWREGPYEPVPIDGTAG